MKKNTKATLMGAVALPAALILALAGCAAQRPAEPAEADQEATEQEEQATPEQDEAATDEAEQEEAPQDEAEEPATEGADAGSPSAGTRELVGGWEVSTEATPTLDTAEVERFEQAAEGLLGVEYEPVCILAKQIVSGTNYAYLCTGTVVEPDETEGWYVATVCEDLEGNVTMGAVNQVDLKKLIVSDDAAARVAGGWQVVEMSVSKLVPQEAQTAFSTALQSYVGVNLRPLAVLGTQVVKGTNYLVLCEGAPVAVDPINSLYVAQVHANLDGTAEFLGVDMFDLLSYVGN